MLVVDPSVKFICSHAFFMLKIVGRVGGYFGTVTFCTAADDFLLSCFVFAPP